MSLSLLYEGTATPVSRTYVLKPTDFANRTAVYEQDSNSTTSDLGSTDTGWYSLQVNFEDFTIPASVAYPAGQKVASVGLSLIFTSDKTTGKAYFDDIKFGTQGCMYGPGPGQDPNYDSNAVVQLNSS